MNFEQKTFARILWWIAVISFVTAVILVGHAVYAMSSDSLIFALIALTFGFVSRLYYEIESRLLIRPEKKQGES